MLDCLFRLLLVFVPLACWFCCAGVVAGEFALVG